MSYQYSNKFYLVPPEADKSWSLQFEHENDLIVKKMRGLLLREFDGIFKVVKPFLQGDGSNWIMVEFWTNNEKLVKNQVRKFLKTNNLNCQIQTLNMME